MNFLTQIRLEKATELINHGNDITKIKDIAQMVGYNNTNHFIDVFKKRYGMTPGEYQKTMYLSQNSH